MLKNINILSPFFEDTTTELGVREYAKLIKVTPPTASKMLKEMYADGLLSKREYRRTLLFSANRDSDEFDELAKFYHHINLKKSGLLKYLDDKLLVPTVILFGSLAKSDNTRTSDVDLCVITKSKTKIDVSKFEKKLGREIQIFRHTSLRDISNKNLANNVLNGKVLSGRLKF